ncbi:uncharacterized protein KY384_001481 [Bacidia gigantensis]|uniref:uncharacterized protein n=1 Tax=Bacidia gigantensis TaxID=2732470 RepID=UPI001D0402E9|nr:uncharacterized protein KY384_001481 [Bacidia gigantensis]KAG8533740.1 hypothetical protein KY384_001481 [Bacidia gigantensis]
MPARRTGPPASYLNEKKHESSSQPARAVRTTYDALTAKENRGIVGAVSMFGILLFYITSDDRLASKAFVSATWATRDSFPPGSSDTNLSFTSEPQSRGLAITSNSNSTIQGDAFVFYVAQNGSAECINIIPDGSGGIVASNGPQVPFGVEGGHVLALAAGNAEGGEQTGPQVGVLTSKRTTYCNLYFSFFTNGSWSDLGLVQIVLVPPLPAALQPNLPSTLHYKARTQHRRHLLNSPILLQQVVQQPATKSLPGDVTIAQVFVPVPSNNNRIKDGYTLFGFWVNGTSLAAYTIKIIGQSGQPESRFPFSRLTGTTAGDQTDEEFVYHQINGTSVAEAVCNTHRGSFQRHILQSRHE